jgi:hypothetical protein
MSYNHRTWPSPRAKVVAKNLCIDNDPITGNRIKRITHAQALDCLARKAGMTVEEFLTLPREESWKALGCLTYSPWSYAPRVYDPLYGLNNSYRPVMRYF